MPAPYPRPCNQLQHTALWPFLPLVSELKGYYWMTTAPRYVAKIHQTKAERNQPFRDDLTRYRSPHQDSSLLPVSWVQMPEGCVASSNNLRQGPCYRVNLVLTLLRTLPVRTRCRSLCRPHSSQY